MGEGSTLGTDELVSVGIHPANGNNSIAINGGAQTINMGSAIPGQIVNFVLTYDCATGTYTLGAKFSTSATFSYVSDR